MASSTKSMTVKWERRAAGAATTTVPTSATATATLMLTVSPTMYD